MSPDRCRSDVHAFFILFGMALLLVTAPGCSSPVSAKTCQVTGDCQPGFQCVSGHCKAAKVGACTSGVDSCTDGSQCASGQCNAGCCASVCATNDDCVPGEICNAGVCESESGPVDAGPDGGTEGCTSELDCSGETPHCLLATGNCVQCRSGADCDSISRCTGEYQCALRPGRCEKDADCTDSSTPACDVPSKQCVQCTKDTQCPNDQTCGADLKCHTTSTGCTKNADCSSTPATPYCKASTAQCVECTSSSQCDTGYACQSNVCVETGCTSNSDCGGSTPYCNTGTAQCVECNSSSQCGTGYDCQSNVCVKTGCTSNADCSGSAGTPYCKTSTAQCVECTSSGQCGNGYACQSNVCVKTGCTSDADCAGTPNTAHCKLSTNACVQCTSDTQCASGETCQSNSCATAPAATACVRASDCAASQSCNVDYNSTNNGFALTCQPANSGGAEGGEACAQDSDCRSNNCLVFAYAPYDGICVSACKPGSQTNDCGFDSICPSGGVARFLPGPNGTYESSSTSTDDAWAAEPTCWPPTCTSDFDCDYVPSADFSYRSCRPWDDVTNPSSSTAVTLYCMPREGAGEAGDDCIDDSDCGSGWCITWQKGSGSQTRTHDSCFGACQNAWNDCWGIDSDCVEVSLTQNGVPVKSCVPNF